MLASEMVAKLAILIQEHGDRSLWHEDNACNAYRLTNVVYDENDDDFRVE